MADVRFKKKAKHVAEFSNEDVTQLIRDTMHDIADTEKALVLLRSDEHYKSDVENSKKVHANETSLKDMHKKQVAAIVSDLRKVAIRLYKSIPLDRLSKHLEKKENEPEEWRSFLNASHNITEFIISEILSHSSINNKVCALERWCAIMQQCYHTHDYLMASSISAALANIAITSSGLRRLLDGRLADQINDMEALFLNGGSILKEMKQLLHKGEHFVPAGYVLTTALERLKGHQENAANTRDDVLKMQVLETQDAIAKKKSRLSADFKTIQNCLNLDADLRTVNVCHLLSKPKNSNFSEELNQLAQQVRLSVFRHIYSKQRSLLVAYKSHHQCKTTERMNQKEAIADQIIDVMQKQSVSLDDKNEHIKLLATKSIKLDDHGLHADIITRILTKGVLTDLDKVSLLESLLKIKVLKFDKELLEITLQIISVMKEIAKLKQSRNPSQPSSPRRQNQAVTASSSTSSKQNLDAPKKSTSQPIRKRSATTAVKVEPSDLVVDEKNPSTPRETSAGLVKVKKHKSNHKKKRRSVEIGSELTQTQIETVSSVPYHAINSVPRLRLPQSDSPGSLTRASSTASILSARTHGTHQPVKAHVSTVIWDSQHVETRENTVNMAAVSQKLQALVEEDEIASVRPRARTLPSQTQSQIDPDPAEVSTVMSSIPKTDGDAVLDIQRPRSSTLGAKTRIKELVGILQTPHSCTHEPASPRDVEIVAKSGSVARGLTFWRQLDTAMQPANTVNVSPRKPPKVSDKEMSEYYPMVKSAKSEVLRRHGDEDVDALASHPRSFTSYK